MKVSVVITAYNVAPYINDCLESVVNQTWKDLDVFVVEDVSTDNTKELLNQWKKKDRRIHTVFNKTNLGAGWGRKIGISHAFRESDSEYILLLDGDDWLSPDFIESLAVVAEKTGADIVSGGITIRHSDGVVDTTSYGNITTVGPDKVVKFWKERIVFMNNKLIRKSIHEKVPYCTRRYIEDTPVIIPMLYFANQVVYVDNVGYNYRMRDKSLTHEATPLKNAIYRAICSKELKNFFADKEPEYQKWIDLDAAFANELKNIKANLTSIQDVEPWKDDFILLSCMLFDSLNFG